MTQPVATKVNPWEKAKAVGSIVAAVLIPLVVLVATNQYNSAAQKRDQNARYIELAIGILQEEPDEESEAVRQWAVDVVNKYSEVKLPEPVRAQLLTRPIRREQVKVFQERAGLTPDGFAGPRTMATLEDEIRELLRAGEKTVAIKRCREVLSLGLKDCKDRVAAIEAALSRRRP